MSDFSPFLHIFRATFYHFCTFSVFQEIKTPFRTMRNTFCAFLKLSPGKENRLSTLYAWQAIFLLYLLPLFYNLPSVNLHRCIAQGCDVFPVMAGQKDRFSFVFQFQK